MAKKEYALFDVKKFKIDVEEEIFSKQKQIILSLPLDVLYILLDTISARITSCFLSLASKDDEIVDRIEDGGVVTKHGVLKHTIFKILFVFDRILQLDHFQELYNHSWEFDESVDKEYNPFVKEGSEEDFYKRYMAIGEVLHHLVGKEGFMPYPSEVKRFCDKLRSMHDEEHWNKSDKFWREVGDFYRTKKTKQKK